MSKISFIKGGYSMVSNEQNGLLTDNTDVSTANKIDTTGSGHNGNGLYDLIDLIDAFESEGQHFMIF